MFMTLGTSLVVLFNCYATADILTNFYGNASCFSLLLLYLGNSQVSVYRTIGPTLVLSSNAISTALHVILCQEVFGVSGRFRCR